MLAFIIETIIAAYRVFVPVRRYPEGSRINWTQVDTATECPACAELNKLHGQFSYIYCWDCYEAQVIRCRDCGVIIGDEGQQYCDDCIAAFFDALTEQAIKQRNDALMFSAESAIWNTMVIVNEAVR